MKELAISLVPEILMDNEGYPTEAWLQYIRNYDPNVDFAPISMFVDILREGWWMPDWGYVLHRKYRGVQKLELHTGGWSGNEEIIREILVNPYLTHFKMRYVKWYTGGHYYFKIKVE